MYIEKNDYLMLLLLIGRLSAVGNREIPKAGSQIGKGKPCVKLAVNLSGRFG